jgi:uncharacterized small protein (DUF1192 family)
MFNDEDLDPLTKRRKPRPLDKMSIAELEDYIADMKTEITRVEADIEKKKAHKDAISSLFKS